MPALAEPKCLRRVEPKAARLATVLVKRKPPVQPKVTVDDPTVATLMEKVVWQPDNRMGLRLVHTSEQGWHIVYETDEVTQRTVMTFTRGTSENAAKSTLDVMANVARESFLGGWTAGYDDGYSQGESDTDAWYDKHFDLEQKDSALDSAT